MISKAVVEALNNFVSKRQILLQEPMAGHTTFRIGGPADCLLQIENEEQLKNVQRYLSLVEVPFFVVGNGSNLLVSDRGYPGVILQIGAGMSCIRAEGERLIVQAGALLSQAAKAALEHGLTGLEFASGIPGSVGGGVVMNAGAYGGELSQVVTQVNAVNREGESLEFDRDVMEFGYRTSVLRKKPFTVTSVTFTLQPGSREQIQARMEELAARRRQKQPLEYPSAGSVFKRPEGYFAGKLIMEAGMRGYQVGGARVSDKHCGFIVNTGKASAGDVLDVICEVRQRVKERFGVDLETEIVYLE